MSTQSASVNAGADERSLDQRIGDRVHHLMWRRRISQVSIAPAMGLTQSTVSKKLHGQVPWSVADLYAAASVLGVEPRDLLPRLDSNQQPFGYSHSQVIDLDEHRQRRLQGLDGGPAGGGQVPA